MNVFHGLKLGSYFPNSLKRIFTATKDKGSISYILSSIEIEDNKKLNSKYSSWFFFQEAFSTISYDCLDDNRIFDFALFTVLHGDDSAAVRNKQFPDKFKNVSEQITSIWGEKTKEDVKHDFWGQQLLRQWVCNNVKIVLTLRSMEEGDSYIDLSFSDIALEKQYEISPLSK